MIKLFERSDCPFCWKVRLVLAELGLPWESEPTALGEKHPSVLALSPAATVPVLVDGGVVLWESAVIVEYLNARYGDGRLLPADPAGQARSRQWQVYSDRVVGPALRDLVFEKRAGPPETWDEERIHASQQQWQACLDYLERHWDASPTFDLASCALAARAGVAEAYGAAIPERFPALRRWYVSVKARPSWQVAYPASFIGIE